MFEYLDIYDARERWIVGAGDALLAAVTAPGRLRPRRRNGPPRRILLLRLERIGDLLMSLGAIRAVRTLAPDAQIDLVIGEWNRAIAELIPEVDAIEVLNAPWLSRGAGAAEPSALARRGLSWRGRRYDLSINFEGDVRSHALARLAGVARRVGLPHAGGRSLLTDVVPHDPARHVADTGLALVERAFDLAPGTLASARSPLGAPAWRLSMPPRAQSAAAACLRQQGTVAGADGRPLLTVHVSAGREVKQWPPERFADVAAALSREHGFAVVLTGSPDDAALVDRAAARLTATGIDARRLDGATDLVVLAALLEQASLLLTGDTGPMHLAAAVGTPLVAVFGPSMPWRYGPLGARSRVVRVDLPCSPCNRIRLPPARCQGHVPDCLERITTAMVHDEASSLLAQVRLAGSAR
jgi:lipopolysaccharide heptosyltransferase II